ncbi:MAG: pyridoxal phosphate-dependent aminotransferase [Lachnospiraceae bacterium]|nr:pyridoxal phosphate-dependent aminotransferase [Lachnospiraceae bacterium]
MFSQSMVELGQKRSTIREIFEYGKTRIAQVGAENVYDFSIGNPSVPAPDSVREAVLNILDTEGPIAAHSYTSAQGDASVRAVLAEDLNRRFGTHFNADNFYLTVGAAAALSACFKALAEPGDEFIVIAPFFPEYQCFIERGAGAKCVVVEADTAAFQINFDRLRAAITPHTKAVIINSPNNPSGTVYSEETIKELAALLTEQSAANGHPIFLISDEPYRELVYDGLKLPFITKYYNNTIVCYSYSKSLSLPGERIGYVLVPDELEDSKTAYAAICGAGRSLGYVNAPSLFQRVAAKCAGQTADLSVYRKNRDLLYEGLVKLGFSCVKPQGAFYIFPRSLEPDASAFCERAKKYDLLFVPGDDFGCPGHVRISYCVPTQRIKKAMILFEKLAAEYR